jgi:hypothetical protein
LDLHGSRDQDRRLGGQAVGGGARVDVAFELLTQRLPDLRLSPPEQSVEFDPNISFRGPKELWAEWTPGEATSGAGAR